MPNGQISQNLDIYLWSSRKGLEATFICMNTMEEERIKISFEFHNTQIQEIKVIK